MWDSIRIYSHLLEREQMYHNFEVPVKSPNGNSFKSSVLRKCLKVLQTWQTLQKNETARYLIYGLRLALFLIVTNFYWLGNQSKLNHNQNQYQHKLGRRSDHRPMYVINLVYIFFIISLTNELLVSFLNETFNHQIGGNQAVKIP